MVFQNIGLFTFDFYFLRFFQAKVKVSFWSFGKGVLYGTHESQGQARLSLKLCFCVPALLRALGTTLNKHTTVFVFKSCAFNKILACYFIVAS